MPPSCQRLPAQLPGSDTIPGGLSGIETDHRTGGDQATPHPGSDEGKAGHGQQGTCGAKVACVVQAADEVSYPPGCLFKGIPQSPQEPVSQQEREAFDG